MKVARLVSVWCILIVNAQMSIGISSYALLWSQLYPGGGMHKAHNCYEFINNWSLCTPVCVYAQDVTTRL